MSTNNPFSFLAKLAFFCMSIFSASSAYSIEKEDLDVNLSPIYLSGKAHKNANVQSEIVVQVPLPLTKNADETGLGPIGALVYFDNKIETSIKSEKATVRGFGRLYYVVSAHSTTHTFIPYITFYREFLVDFQNISGKNLQSKSKAWLPPGFMYAYRVNDKFTLHMDAELYSYKVAANNLAKIGVSYALSDKWRVSASYERQAWDIKDDVNKAIFMNGSSNNVYLKLINSNPLRNNFAFTWGYAMDRNTPGFGLPQQVSANRSNGFLWGIEITLGTLAW